MFTEKDISNLSTDFSGRNQYNGKIHFGISRTKRIKVILHKVKYFYSISGDPTIVYINGVIFIKKFDIDLYRADIRKKLMYQSHKKAKQASSGPLDSENKWE